MGASRVFGGSESLRPLGGKEACGPGFNRGWREEYSIKERVFFSIAPDFFRHRPRSPAGRLFFALRGQANGKGSRDSGQKSRGAMRQGEVENPKKHGKCRKMREKWGIINGKVGNTERE
jgi:hypothetical protein